MHGHMPTVKDMKANRVASGKRRKECYNEGKATVKGKRMTKMCKINSVKIKIDVARTIEAVEWMSANSVHSAGVC
jgi:hypothetical protein